MSSTTRLNSARPFTAFPVLDYNKADVFNDRPVIDGVVIPRNTFRNRPFYDVSLRFQRHFDLPNEKGRLIASVEFFNLFGFNNVMIDHDHMRYGPGTVMEGGQIVSGGIGPGRWYDPISRKTYEGGTIVPVAPPEIFNQLRDASGEYYRDNIPGDPFQMQLGLRFQF